jgi:hypothetical protein
MSVKVVIIDDKQIRKETEVSLNKKKILYSNINF